MPAFHASTAIASASCCGCSRSGALVIALAFAAFGFAMSRSATIALLGEVRYGWWGAMPVPEAATRRGLHLNAILLTVFGNLVILFVLVGIVLLSRRSTPWFMPLAMASGVGFWLGSGAGYSSYAGLGTLKRGKIVQQHSSAALLPLRALDHPQLRHLPDWQRRETVRRWRSGGRNWQFLAFGLLVPMGMPLLPLLGLLLLGVALIWYGLALRASEDLLVRATRLFAALPLPFPRFARRARLRCPLFAWACTKARARRDGPAAAVGRKSVRGDRVRPRGRPRRSDLAVPELALSPSAASRPYSRDDRSRAADAVRLSIAVSRAAAGHGSRRAPLLRRPGLA